MNLADAVATYLRIAGEFGRPVHLSQLALNKAQIEKAFSAWDEDYQISRYMLLGRAPDEELASRPPGSRLFLINGHEYSHVTFRSDIQRLLAAV